VLFAVLSGLVVAVCFGATVWWTGGDMTRQAVRSLSGGRLRRAGPRGTASGGSAAGGTEAM
jgi:hypothetical protein